MDKPDAMPPGLHVLQDDDAADAQRLVGDVPAALAAVTAARPRVMLSALMHPSLARHVGEMQAKLDANEHKGWWIYDAPFDLLVKLMVEVIELIRAPVDDVRQEAADVANYAMMYADAVSFQHGRDTLNGEMARRKG